MFGRVIFAAILGAVLVFATGAASHIFLQWESRTFKKAPSATAVKTAVGTLFAGEGVYSVPPMPDKPHNQMTKEEQEANDAEWKAGPNAFIVVRPKLNDNAMPMMMAMEFASNFVCALIVAIVLSMTRPRVGFIGRWFAAILLGVFAWASVSFSHFVWWGFPWEYIQDQLFCQAAEWAVGGFIIAALVRPVEVVRY